MDITYGVYLEKLDVDTGTTALTDDEVKVYLTDYEGNALLNPTKISELNSEKMIYADTNTHDGTTMMAGHSNTGEKVGYFSGYTGILYESGTYTSYTGVAYPENKYLDKYSFGTSSTQKKRSKLGDAVKEVTTTSGVGWYSDYGYIAYASSPWFRRGGYYAGALAGVFSSYDFYGSSGGHSARVVISQ